MYLLYCRERHGIHTSIKGILLSLWWLNRECLMTCGREDSNPRVVKCHHPTCNHQVSLLSYAKNWNMKLCKGFLYIKLITTACTLWILCLSRLQGSQNTRSRWRNGLARLQQWPCYLQGPGFESHLRPVEFFACNKVSPLNNRTLTLTSVPCAPIN